MLAPAELLRFPIHFAGAHGGYWEHPGPAISCLLVAAIAFFSRLPLVRRQVLVFSAVSAAGWIVLLGGVSPHYVIALAGLWTAACVGVLDGMPGRSAQVLRNALALCVFYQALVAMVAVLIGWGPRDVAFGIITKRYYLTSGLEPRKVHYPVRKIVEERIPQRGVVYADIRYEVDEAVRDRAFGEGEE